MGRITIKKGDAFYLDRIFTEKDICLYAGITDGFYPGQIRSEAGQTSSGAVLVPEGLLLGLMSIAASMASHTAGRMIHSIGYDNLTFLKPVIAGEKVTVSYTIDEIDNENMYVLAKCQVVNQKGERILSGIHRQEIGD